MMAKTRTQYLKRIQKYRKYKQNELEGNNTTNF